MAKEQPVDFAYTQAEFLKKNKELKEALKKLKLDKTMKIVWEYKPAIGKKAPWWEFYMVKK
jgi:hypothetical protein